MITVSRRHVEKVIEQARRCAPVECCGLLAGRVEGNTIEIIDVFPMTNVDNSPTHFSLDPKEQFKVYYEVKDRGLQLLGNYHSHPETPARPSEEDIRLAYDSKAVYMIISLLCEEPVLKCFFIRDGQYEEIKLVILE